MKELINIVQSLGQPNWLDYVQLLASVSSVIISAIALFFAIRIPVKIAKEQNMIALFEKRYELFQFYVKCVSLASSIKREVTLDGMRNSCWYSFEIDCKKVELNELLLFIEKLEYISYQMHFLFPEISEGDVRKLYLSLYHFILQMVDVKGTVHNEKNIENFKDEFIDAINDFKQKYERTIIKQLELCNIE